MQESEVVTGKCDYFNLNVCKNKYSHWRMNFILTNKNKDIDRDKNTWLFLESFCSNSIPQYKVIHPATIACISVLLYLSFLYGWILFCILIIIHRVAIDIKAA